MEGAIKSTKKNCTHISPPFQVREEERFRKNGFLFVVRRFDGRVFFWPRQGGGEYLHKCMTEIDLVPVSLYATRCHRHRHRLQIPVVY